MQIDELNDKFVEARDEIEFAQEDAETTYFNESHNTAKHSVGEVLALYQQIQEDLSQDDKGKLQRSMGMKMEQLKVCSDPITIAQEHHIALVCKPLILLN